MRISDWSSDVCSSDLPDLRRGVERHPRLAEQLPGGLDRTALSGRQPRRDGTLDGHSDRRGAAAARRRTAAQESARHLRRCHQLVAGARLMAPMLRRPAVPVLLAPAPALAGCATAKPPRINYAISVPPPPPPPAPPHTT